MLESDKQETWSKKGSFAEEEPLDSVSVLPHDELCHTDVGLRYSITFCQHVPSSTSARQTQHCEAKGTEFLALLETSAALWPPWRGRIRRGCLNSFLSEYSVVVLR